MLTFFRSSGKRPSILRILYAQRTKNFETLNPRNANLLQVQREEDVQKEDLVRPDDALLLRLLVQPGRPLVRHQLVLKAVLAGHVRDEILERRNGRLSLISVFVEEDLA